MKKVIALLTIMIFIFALAGCGAKQTNSQNDTTKSAKVSSNTSDSSKATDKNTEEQNNDTDNSGKTLVVYFSATGTTKGVAEQIASYTNADI